MVVMGTFSCHAAKTGKIERAALLVPTIIRTIPHDTAAFTQGLFFHQGKLYESTGLVGRSSLRVIDPNTGRVEKNIPVEDVFAEGIAFLDSLLVQLTWQNGIGIVYSFPALRGLKTFAYEGEGWGLTSDGKSFIMSDGSGLLQWRDGKFNAIRSCTVTLNGKQIGNINELEFCRNRIYANIWYKNFIIEIDPQTGMVMSTIDCTGLVQSVASTPGIDVLNGIAYDASKKTFYLTGKKWPSLFEVSIPERK